LLWLGLGCVALVEERDTGKWRLNALGRTHCIPDNVRIFQDAQPGGMLFMEEADVLWAGAKRNGRRPLAHRLLPQAEALPNDLLRQERQAGIGRAIMQPLLPIAVHDAKDLELSRVGKRGGIGHTIRTEIRDERAYGEMPPPVDLTEDGLPDLVGAFVGRGLFIGKQLLDADGAAVESQDKAFFWWMFLVHSCSLS